MSWSKLFSHRITSNGFFWVRLYKKTGFFWYEEGESVNIEIETINKTHRNKMDIQKKEYIKTVDYNFHQNANILHFYRNESDVPPDRDYSSYRGGCENEVSYLLRGIIFSSVSHIPWEFINLSPGKRRGGGRFLLPRPPSSIAAVSVRLSMILRTIF